MGVVRYVVFLSVNRRWADVGLCMWNHASSNSGIAFQLLGCVHFIEAIAIFD